MQMTLSNTEENNCTTTAAAPVQLLIGDAYISKAAECITSAKGRINICAYTWKWYENAPEKAIQKFNYAIACKIKQGVEVRAIIEMDAQSTYLEMYGIKCRKLPTRSVQHAKVIQVDGQFLILGSHNLTDRATADNYEVSIVTSDADAILLFDDYFNTMWNNFK